MNTIINNDHIQEFANNVFKIRIVHKTLTNVGVNLPYAPHNLTTHIQKAPFFRNRVKTRIPILCKDPFNLNPLHSHPFHLPNELVDIICSYANTFIPWLHYKVRMAWILKSHELIQLHSNAMLHTNGISNFTYRRFYSDNIKNMYDETNMINQFECQALAEYVRYL